MKFHDLIYKLFPPQSIVGLALRERDAMTVVIFASETHRALCPEGPTCDAHNLIDAAIFCRYLPVIVDGYDAFAVRDAEIMRLEMQRSRNYRAVV